MRMLEEGRENLLLTVVTFSKLKYSFQIINRNTKNNPYTKNTIETIHEET